MIHFLFMTHVQRQENLLGPGRAVDFLGTFRVCPYIEFRMRHHIALFEEGAGHVDHPLHHRRDFRRFIQGFGQVRRGADDYQGDFSRISFDGLDDEIRSSLSRWRHGGRSAIVFLVLCPPGRWLVIAGGAQVGVEVAAEFFFLLCHAGEAPFPRRLIHAQVDRDVLAANPFQLSNGGGRPGLYPGISENHGHPFELHIRRLRQHHHGHTIIKKIDHVRIQDHLLLRRHTGNRQP